MFDRLTRWAILITGGKWAFLFSLSALLVWLFTGPYFGYSDTWQLTANTVMSVVTFLMVFLIQGAQNRESKAVHLKLDELILSIKRARNEVVGVEDFPIDKLNQMGSDRRQAAQGDRL